VCRLQTLRRLAAEKAEVYTLDDMMGYAKHYIKQISKYLPSGALEYLVYHLPRAHFNTFFSGVDAYGSGISVLAAVLRDELCIDVKEPVHLSAVEKDDDCIRELLDHPNPPVCLFKDIMQFFKPAVAKKMEALQKCGKSLDFETLLPLIMSGQAVSLVGDCKTHNRRCTLRCGKMVVSGVTCWDYSPMGGRTTLHGRTQPCQAAWASLIKKLLPAMNLFENSHKYPVDALRRMFVEYLIFDTIVDPQMLGGCNRRERLWAPMFLRDTVLTVWGSLKNVIPLFERIFRGTFHVLLVSTEEEIAAELKSLASRRKSQACTMPEAELLADKMPFRRALTVVEDNFRAGYLRMGCHESMAVQLNQNKELDNHGMQSTPGGILHTIIRNCGPLYIHSLPCGKPLERTMTAQEILLANCFPIRGDLVNPGSPHSFRCCSFAPPSSVTSRTRSTMVQQCGNSMNVSVCVLLQVYMLLFVHRRDAAFD
jgi:hypothetical protein